MKVKVSYYVAVMVAVPKMGDFRALFMWRYQKWATFEYAHRAETVPKRALMASNIERRCGVYQLST
jgi:hypothetical protein